MTCNSTLDIPGPSVAHEKLETIVLDLPCCLNLFYLYYASRVAQSKYKKYPITAEKIPEKN